MSLMYPIANSPELSAWTDPSSVVKYWEGKARLERVTLDSDWTSVQPVSNPVAVNIASQPGRAEEGLVHTVYACAEISWNSKKPLYCLHTTVLLLDDYLTTVRYLYIFIPFETITLQRV